MLSKKTKFILSTISALLMHFGTAPIFAFGGLNVYITSYINRFFDDTINLHYGLLLMPLMLVSLTVFIPLAGFLESKLGSRTTMVLGELSNLLLIFALSKSKNIFLFYLFSILFGVGCAACNAITGKNIAFYYPKYKGVIGASVASINTIFAMIFGVTGELLINPKGLQVESDRLFSKEIAGNLPKYFYIMAAILILCTTAALFFFIKFDPKKDFRQEDGNRIKDAGYLDESYEDNNGGEKVRGDRIGIENEGNKDNNRNVAKDNNKNDGNNNNNVGKSSNNNISDNNENSKNTRNKNEDKITDGQKRTSDKNDTDTETDNALTLGKNDIKAPLFYDDMWNSEIKEDVPINVNQIYSENKNIKKEECINKHNFSNIVDSEAIKENYKSDLKEVFFNRRIWIIALISATGHFSAGYVLNTFRTFVTVLKEDGRISQFLGLFITFSILFFSPIWGFLHDKIGFRKVIFTITLVGLLTSVLLVLFFDNKAVYRVLICLSGVVISGLMTSVNPHVMHVFGIKYSLEIGGVIGICNGFSSLSGALISFLLGVHNDTAEFLIPAYRIVFSVGCVMSIAAFVIQFLEDNSQFKYKNYGSIDDLIENVDNEKIEADSESSNFGGETGTEEKEKNFDKGKEEILNEEEKFGNERKSGDVGDVRNNENDDHNKNGGCGIKEGEEDGK